MTNLLAQFTSIWPELVDWVKLQRLHTTLLNLGTGVEPDTQSRNVTNSRSRIVAKQYIATHEPLITRRQAA